jgi:hypothetical protein
MDTPIRKILIEKSTGLVLNVVMYDSEANWSPLTSEELVDDAVGVSIGDTWDGSQFIAPPLPPKTKADEVRDKLRDKTQPPITLDDVVVLLRDNFGLTELVNPQAESDSLTSSDPSN